MSLTLLITIAPIFCAYILYKNPAYWPKKTSNYGTIIKSRSSIYEYKNLDFKTLNGDLFNFEIFKGKWLILSIDSASCKELCAEKLFISRNCHASQGKNVSRLIRVWLIVDDGTVPEDIIYSFKGTIMLRAQIEQLQKLILWNSELKDISLLTESIWIIDPLGNLTLRSPKNPDGTKLCKDIRTLIYNSHIG
ncbi:MAG: hypothetical protein IR526_03345 [Bordetella sp.]|nr:MAG: hypothetical protein IR526_03345 [Bordetella sp.]